jgi:hypothetical protein
MKPVQSTSFVLLLMLSLLFPFASAKAANSALTLPIAGTVSGGGLFSGTLTIDRFVGENHELMAVGIVRGTVTDGSGQVVKSGLQDVVLPVHIGQRTVSFAIPPSSAPRLLHASLTEGAGGRFVLTQAQSCGILHLDIGGNTVDLLGFSVMLSPITLDISGSSAGPLGALVCQIVGLLGTVANVVGLLNNLLGMLTSLAGGLI